MKALALITCLALTFPIASAQEAPRYIDVTGSAEMELSPNIIVLSVRLREFEEGRVKTTLAQLDGELLAAATRSKVEKDKLVVTDVNLYSYQRRRNDRDVNAQKTYEITFSKAEEVMTFLENLKAVNVDMLRVAKLSHTEMEKHRLQLKIDALKAAETKAGALLTAIGSKRGKPLVIEEIQADFVPFNPSAEQQLYRLSEQQMYKLSITGAVHRGMNMDEDITASDVPLKMIKLRFEIRARFAIE